MNSSRLFRGGAIPPRAAQHYVKLTDVVFVTLCVWRGSLQSDGKITITYSKSNDIV
jgi:hypothetical protein